MNGPILRPPPLARLGWEALAGLELARLLAASPGLLRAPRGERAVLVLPGFAADDASTLPLRAFLRRLLAELEIVMKPENQRRFGSLGKQLRVR